MKVYKYYYNSLSPERQSVYKVVYEGLRAHNRFIDLDGTVEVADIGQVVQYVSLDNPLFFYVDFRKISVRETASVSPMFGSMRARGGRKFRLVPRYTFSRAEADKLNGDIGVALNKIVAAVKGGRDYVKALRAHDILARAVKYDIAALTNNLANYNRTNSIVGALLDKKAVCEGIAKTYKLVLDALDIPSAVVVGETSDDNGVARQHAWNVVHADDMYFHVDLTGDIGGTTRGNVCRNYFGLSDRQIAADHRVFADAPKCMSDGCDFFTKAGFVAQSQADVKRIVQEAVSRNERKATIRMPNNCFADNNQLLEFVQNVLRQSAQGFCRVECSVNQKFGVYTFSWK